MSMLMDSSEYLDLANKGRPALWRYVLSLILAVGLQIAIFTLVIVAFHIFGVSENNIYAMFSFKNAGNPTLFFSGVLLLFGAELFSFIISFRIVLKKRFQDIVGPWSWRLCFAGAGIWLIIATIGSVIDYVYAPAQFHWAFETRVVTGVWLVALALLVQTFCEEFLFRGFLTQMLYRYIHRLWPTALISGFIFGAFHIPNGNIQAVSAGIFGVTASVIAMRSGNLAFGFGVHFINNLFCSIIVAAQDDVFKNAPAIFVLTETTSWYQVVLELISCGALLLLFEMICKKSPVSHTGSGIAPNSRLLLAMGNSRRALSK